MKILKTLGIGILGVIALASIGRGILALIAVVMIISHGTHANISYVLGQFAGSALMLALSAAGIKALVKSMNVKPTEPPPL